jgi:hypothetical protein
MLLVKQVTNARRIRHGLAHDLGQRGLAINGEIEWRQGGQLFIIQSVTYAYATLGSPELIAIAESLR